VKPRAVAIAVAVVLAAATSAACATGGPSGPASSDVQYGSQAAPFSLVDQFGHRRQLSDFRGSVVLLTFIDPHCTGVCPLTADLLRRAKESAGGDPSVQLVAIDANPKATSVDDARRWSVRHGMLHDWLFLTGSTRRLRRVWAEYGVKVIEQGGDVAHSSAVFLIDPNGRERGIFPIAARSGIPAEVPALAQAVQRIA
jgi:cytochrome oxidase Cu insertion factor (SCO1/SenC/PrrC family)